MSLYVKDSGSWRNITSIYVKDGGQWRNITEGWIKESGVWRQFWTSGPAYYYSIFSIPTSGGYTQRDDFTTSGSVSGTGVEITLLTAASAGFVFDSLSANNSATVAGLTVTIQESGTTSISVTYARIPTFTVDLSSSATFNQGDSASLNVIVDGYGKTVTYEWYKDNTLEGGETTDTWNLGLADPATTPGAYQVVASTTAGTISSVICTVYVKPYVEIYAGDGNIDGVSSGYFDIGGTYSIEASTTGPSYEDFNFTNWSIEGDGSITINNVNTNPSTVTVQAASASVRANYVRKAPIITVDLAASETYNQNEAVSLSVTVNTYNAPSVTYEWYKDNVLDGGQTTNTWNLGNADPATDPGNYQVVITTEGGSVSSTVCTVSVKPYVEIYGDPPDGIIDGVNSGYFDIGGTYTIEASSYPGFDFTYWSIFSGSITFAGSVSANPTTVTVEAASASIRANYVATTTPAPTTTTTTPAPTTTTSGP